MKDCKNIIDIGSGTGLFYDTAVKEEKIIIGIDIDKKQIRDNIIFRNYKDINKHFDCFFSSLLIEHINQFEFMEV